MVEPMFRHDTHTLKEEEKRMDKHAVSAEPDISRRGLLAAGGVLAAGALVSSQLVSVACADEETDAEIADEDVADTDVTVVAGHEREGLPSFLTKPEPITDVAQTYDYDVVVIGAGASGTPAALSALEAGASVALLQKESTAISQGNTGAGIDLANSDEGAAEALVQKLVRDNCYRAKPELIRLWAQNGGEAVSWVIDKVSTAGGPMVNQGNNQQSKATNLVNGYAINYVTAYAGPKPDNAGTCMITLAQVAEEEGVDVYYSTPAMQLVQDETGTVTGVIAQDADGNYLQFNAAKGVIVATGDYQNDDEMVNYYIPDLKNMGRKQFNKTGDGHKMVIWAGGEMEGIGHTKMMHDFDAGPMWNMPFMAVKASTGRRFMDEKVDMAYVNNYLRSSEDAGVYCQVFDANYVNSASTWEGCGAFVDPEGLQNYMPELDIEHTGVIEGLIATYQADTLEELAGKLGIADVDAFLDEVARYNEICAAGVDDECGKDPQYLAPIDTPPFYGIRRTARVSAICSGVVVNADHQCLTPEGEPIPGLYAIGNCSGGFYGGVDYPLSVGGLSLGRCYTEGYVIGRMVAGL